MPDADNLELWLDVDGQRYQDGSTRTMVFGVPYLVSYLSRFMSLQPGDVISTGTPPGVGHGKKPPVYLRAGNEMRLGVEGLGEQRQRVVDRNLSVLRSRSRFFVVLVLRSPFIVVLRFVCYRPDALSQSIADGFATIVGPASVLTKPEDVSRIASTARPRCGSGRRRSCSRDRSRTSRRA